MLLHAFVVILSFVLTNLVKGICSVSIEPHEYLKNIPTVRNLFKLVVKTQS